MKKVYGDPEFVNGGEIKTLSCHDECEEPKKVGILLSACSLPSISAATCLSGYSKILYRFGVSDQMMKSGIKEVAVGVGRPKKNPDLNNPKDVLYSTPNFWFSFNLVPEFESGKNSICENFTLSNPRYSISNGTLPKNYSLIPKSLTSLGGFVFDEKEFLSPPLTSLLSFTVRDNQIQSFDIFVSQKVFLKSRKNPIVKNIIPPQNLPLGLKSFPIAWSIGFSEIENSYYVILHFPK